MLVRLCWCVLRCFSVSVGSVREQLISEKNFLCYDEGGVILSLSNLECDSRERELDEVKCGSGRTPNSPLEADVGALSSGNQSE